MIAYCHYATLALAAALQLPPTVILQDLVMPGIDAFGLIEQYRAGPPGAPGGIVTLSTGVASVIPSRAGTLEQLIARADKALHAAKSSGRNRVCVADAELNQPI